MSYALSVKLMTLSVFAAWLVPAARADVAPILDKNALANQYYGSNAAWFASNIPFLETSDANIQQIYYYRWDVVNKHLLYLPTKDHWVMTEFYHPVWWESPDRTIDAAAGHHIYEARWLADRTYDDSYIDYWFRAGGNRYQYSFWAADSVYKHYLATGDAGFAQKYLPDMKSDYAGWVNARYDANRQLFWQNPLEDATEYSVSGLEVGNGEAGNAYRPSFNSYMYANATAISRIAQLAGDSATAQDYAAKAAAIKSKLQSELWNPQQQLFMDRHYEPGSPNLDYQFVGSRELEGYLPWYFGVPDDDATFASAWNHLMDAEKFLGAYGLRTVEKNSQYYMNPLSGKASPYPEFCAWNGPSWPYYTSMVLGAMANLLDDYSQQPVTGGDYLTLLRQYTMQQYKDGQPYIAEDYQPDDDYWLVDVPNRSEHYFHSTYTDLVITGLAGLRPRADNTIQINPLIDSSMGYLCLQDIPYHGHEVTILWDRDNRYGLGTGLRLIVDGKVVGYSPTIGPLTAALPMDGDANFDGMVDISDLGILATNWQTACKWTGGDFDHNGFVDISDLGLLASNWQAGASGLSGITFDAALRSMGWSSGTVPEPTVVAWLMVGLCVLVRRPR